MDISSIMNMLSGDNLNGLSEKLGVDPAQISSVIEMSVPQLLNGMQKNASTEEGAQSLEEALSQHSSADTSDVSAFLVGADIEDGAKIVNHILGSENAAAATGEISEKSGLSLGNVGSILGSVAPFLMSLLGKENESSQNTSSDSGSGSGIGSLLGGLLDKDGDGLDLGDISTAATTLLGSGSTTTSGKKKKKKKKKSDNSGLLQSILNLFR